MKYRLKQTAEIEALQYDGTPVSAMDIVEFCRDYVEYDKIYIEEETRELSLSLDYTSAGDSILYSLDPMDWLVRCENGLYSVHTDRVFNDYFEKDLTDYHVVGYIDHSTMKQCLDNNKNVLRELIGNDCIVPSHTTEAINFSKNMTLTHDIGLYLKVNEIYF